MKRKSVMGVLCGRCGLSWGAMCVSIARIVKNRTRTLKKPETADGGEVGAEDIEAFSFVIKMDN
jgi:hypothetical protein